MSGFSEIQVASLESPLARETVKQRDQAGRKFSYIEGWHTIAEANRIFGFDAWDRELVEIKCVAERERKIGRDDRPERQKDGHQVSYLARVRVTVRAGDMMIRREGVGYGSGIDADLGAAHESAAKEAETDAMKRALVTFGNPFGLALYDKDQAEVAPATRPVPAANAPRQQQQTRAPAAAPKPNGNGAAPHADHPRRAEAVAAWQRLNHALNLAKTTKEGADLYRIHADNLNLIEEVSRETFATLKKRFSELGIDVAAERKRGQREPGEDNVPAYLGADDAASALS